MLLLARIFPFEPRRLQRLRAAQLVDSTALVSFSRRRPDERAYQLARLMLQEEGQLVDNGCSPSADLSAEVQVLQTLAECASQGAKVLEDPLDIKGAAAELAAAFRIEKSALLRACANELRACVNASKVAGVLQLPSNAPTEAEKAVGKLPGFGLSRVSGRE